MMDMDMDIYPISEHEWVEVKNTEQSVRSINVTFKFGDACLINPGGSVTVLGSEGTDILLLYTAPNQAARTECPSGILFVRPLQWVQSLHYKAQQHEMQKKAERAKIQRMLRSAE